METIPYLLLLTLKNTAVVTLLLAEEIFMALELNLGLENISLVERLRYATDNSKNPNNPIFLKEEAPPVQKDINDAPHPLLPMRRVVKQLGCGIGNWNGQVPFM